MIYNRMSGLIVPTSGCNLSSFVTPDVLSILGFGCYYERKTTIKPQGLQCVFLRMLTILSPTSLLRSNYMDQVDIKTNI